MGSAADIGLFRRIRHSQDRSQRRFLRALVKNTAFWDPTNGNAYLWFERAGLPYDRNACAKLLNKHEGSSANWKLGPFGESPCSVAPQVDPLISPAGPISRNRGWEGGLTPLLHFG